MVQTARTEYYDGLGYYMDLGHVPEDKNGASVSKTLEYAYDDWAIAQAARKLVGKIFMKSSWHVRKIIKMSTISGSGFMRPKLSDGSCHLGEGRTFKVVARNQSEKNVFVERVESNGKELQEPVITHEDLMDGEKLVLYMSPEPNKDLYN